MLKLCLACDSSVPPSGGRKPRKWCSESCRVWALRYPGEKRGSPRTCEGCSADISHRNRGAVWCSDTCRFRSSPRPPRPCDECGVPVKSFGPVALCEPCKAARKRERQRRYNQTKRCTCTVCGQPFTGTWRKTCSDECARVLTAETAAERRMNWPKCSVWFRSCGHCGVVFTARHHSQAYCGDGCAESAKRDAYVEYQKRRSEMARGPFPCAGCGTGQFPRRDSKCDVCKAEAKRRHRRRAKRKRRALKLGVESEPYTLAEISLRDGYRCGLCDQKVPMDRVVPHSKAPTIDHIVPLSRGGDDIRANVQLAHFLCNSLKGDRGGYEQLALIG